MFTRPVGVLTLLIALPLAGSEQPSIGYLAPSPQLFEGALTLNEGQADFTSDATCIIWRGPQ